MPCADYKISSDFLDDKKSEREKNCRMHASNARKLNSKKKKENGRRGSLDVIESPNGFSPIVYVQAFFLQFKTALLYFFVERSIKCSFLFRGVIGSKNAMSFSWQARKKRVGYSSPFLVGYDMYASSAAELN